jgi:hypothetical protein
VNSEHEAEHIGPGRAEVEWTCDDGGRYTVTGRPDLVAAFLDLIGRGVIDPGPAGRLELEPE